MLGSSLGGLISCYACWTRAAEYGRCACMSSSMWWANEWMNQLVATTPPADAGMALSEESIMSNINCNHCCNVRKKISKRSVLKTPIIFLPILRFDCICDTWALALAQTCVSISTRAISRRPTATTNCRRSAWSRRCARAACHTSPITWVQCCATVCRRECSVNRSLSKSLLFVPHAISENRVEHLRCFRLSFISRNDAFLSHLYLFFHLLSTCARAFSAPGGDHSESAWGARSDVPLTALYAPGDDV